MSRQTVQHKMEMMKVPPGHNPMQPLCGADDWAVFMASKWKDVTCKRCFKIGKKAKKKK